MLVSILPKIPRNILSRADLVKPANVRLCSAVAEPDRQPKARKKLPRNGPSLQHFLSQASNPGLEGNARRLELRKTPIESHPYLSPEMLRGDGLKGLLNSMLKILYW